MRRLRPWRHRVELARRDAEGAAREADLIRARRPLVDRIVYELGLHERRNNFVGIIHSVARGVK